MDRFIKLAVLAVVVYFGITAVLPRLKEMGGGGRADLDAIGEGGHCVIVAQEASSEFGREIREFSRPSIDVESWDRVERQLNDTLSGAEDACSCPEEACETARQALDELRSIIYDFDSGFRGEQPVPFNAARDMQRVHDLLDEARSLAR